MSEFFKPASPENLHAREQIRIANAYREIRTWHFGVASTDAITFLGIEFPIVSALLPSLVLNEVPPVAALGRRSGAVFYLELNDGELDDR